VSVDKIKKVDDFLKEAGVFFLATVDGDQPKCRPMGLHLVIDGQLYFGVGDFKEVYKQLCKNPKTEIVAAKGNDWLRIYGKAIFEKDDTIANSVLNASPFLREIYNEQTGYKLAIFHLEEATAEFRSLMDVVETYQF